MSNRARRALQSPTYEDQLAEWDATLAMYPTDGYEIPSALEHLVEDPFHEGIFGSIGDVIGMTPVGQVLGAVGDVVLGAAEGGVAAGPRRRRGRPNTQTGMIAMPARLPNIRQWKRINKRLHAYRSISIGIINRTGGMRRRRWGGYRRSRRGRR